MGPVMDEIRLKLIWDRLIAITDEVSAELVRVAFSSAVRDGNDYACTILDNKGRLLAQGRRSVPSFIGTVAVTLRHILKRHPLGSLRPGDTLITNNPWMATGHLPDITMLTPIFLDGRVIAFTGCVAHMTDIGGALGRGTTRELFEEGLHIPMVKLVKAGEVNQDVIDFVKWNVRNPEETQGDLMGMLAANELAAQRLVALLAEEELGDIEAVGDEIFSRSEKATRAGIAQAKSGKYRGESEIDIFEDVVKVCANVSIEGDSIHVDYAGSSPQTTKAINSVMNYTTSYTAYVLKCLFAPDVPNNDGCLKPLTVTAPEGSIVNPLPPASVVSRSTTGHILHGAIFQALAAAIPERIMGESGSAPTSNQFFAFERRGKPYVLKVTGNGGTGACPNKDGEVCTFPSNISNTPIEFIESAVPFHVERKAVLADSAGAGRFRGGVGHELSMTVLGDKPVRVGFAFCRILHPPRGVLGGGDGSCNAIFLNGVRDPKLNGKFEIQPGDTLTLHFPGGGGKFPPTERAPEAVLEDVRNGVVSPEAAERVYGVCLTPDGKEVDREATAARRAGGGDGRKEKDRK